MVTNGGEKEMVSAAGSARVMTQLEAARVIRAPTLRAGSNARRVVVGDELDGAQEAGAAHLADQRMVGERLGQAAR